MDIKHSKEKNNHVRLMNYITQCNIAFINQIIPYLPTCVQPQHTRSQTRAISSVKAAHLSGNRACEYLIKRSKYFFSPNTFIMLGLHDEKTTGTK